MTQQQTPPWYQPGDIAASVRRATTRDEVSTTAIVDVLATHELDTPRTRIRSLVETTHDQLADNPNTESPPSSEMQGGEPRPLSPRIVAADDIAYLGSRDFARVLGAILSQYEGGFDVAQQVDESAVDVFWYRQQTTVAFRTVPRTPETTIDASIIKAVAEGDTNPASGRPASTVGIVSNAEFSSDAHMVAAANDITLFEQPTLERWLQQVHLTHDVLGDLLEQQDLTDEEYESILDDLPALPPQLQDQDPLTRHPPTIDQPPSEIERDPIPNNDADPDTDKDPDPDDGTPQDGSSGELLGDAPADPGEQGVLYADPDEDGDAAAFDRFEAELTEDSE
jgi:hypothetical protein